MAESEPALLRAAELVVSNGGFDKYAFDQRVDELVEWIGAEARSRGQTPAELVKELRRDYPD